MPWLPGPMLLRRATGTGPDMDLIHFLILAIILAGVIAVVVIAVRAMGLAIPAWFWQLLSVVAIVVVAILAIKLILSVW